MDPAILLAITGAIVGALASLLASWVATESRRKLEKFRIMTEEKLKKAFYEQLSEYSKETLEVESDEIWKNWIEESASSSASALVSITAMRKEDIQREIDEKVSSVKSRIIEIENRLPAKNILDKVASVNEAILTTQIENLTESVKRLEGKLLSHWDVAKIVFLILTVLSALVGVVFTIINYVVKAA